LTLIEYLLTTGCVTTIEEPQVQEEISIRKADEFDGMKIFFVGI